MEEVAEKKVEYCGLCSHKCKQGLLLQKDKFVKSCVICNKDFYNHPSCASKYVNSSKTVTTSTDSKTRSGKKLPKVQVTVEEFNDSIVPYYCFECQQKQCFSPTCAKNHTLNPSSTKIICSVCKKKWSIVIDKCSVNVDNLLCKECHQERDKNQASLSSTPSKHQSSQSTEGEQLSQVSVSLRREISSNLTRFQSDTDASFLLYPQVPDKYKKDIKDAIQIAYNIDTQDSDMFADFDTAKQYFDQKFLYIPDNERESNIFDLIIPPCCENEISKPYTRVLQRKCFISQLMMYYV